MPGVLAPPRVMQPSSRSSIAMPAFPRRQCGVNVSDELSMRVGVGDKIACCRLLDEIVHHTLPR